MELLPASDTEIHIQTRRVVEGMYEVSHGDGLRWRVYTPSFIEIGLGIRKLVAAYTGTQQHCDLINQTNFVYY
jgi:hypothetical protein